MTSRRRLGAAIGAAAAATVILALTLSGAPAHHAGPAPTTTAAVTTTTNPYAAEEARALAGAEGAVNVRLPSREGAPAPQLAPRPYRKGLGPHQVVGFVPYYELGSLAGTSLAGFTYLVYSALEVTASGSLVESSSSGAWSSLEDGLVDGLVATGHAEGDRVLLSVFAESQSVLGPLSSHPLPASRHLAAALAPVLARFGFDGVDLDLEGEDASDRAGFVAFVTDLSSRLRLIDGSWTIMLDTYPESAADTTGFFDVAALARSVDYLFVMAYDMYENGVPSPNAPLAGSALSDVSTLATYRGAGLAAKVILGVPFYGYDFPASGPFPGAETEGQPYAVTYDEIAASVTTEGRKPRWDPSSDTPYIVFRRKGRWHQTWFDDPTSIALKTALAAQFHVAGVGAWELGMVQGEPTMISLLAGGSPVVKLPLATEP